MTCTCNDQYSQLCKRIKPQKLQNHVRSTNRKAMHLLSHTHFVYTAGSIANTSILNAKEYSWRSSWPQYYIHCVNLMVVLHTHHQHQFFFQQREQWTSLRWGEHNGWWCPAGWSDPQVDWRWRMREEGERILRGEDSRPLELLTQPAYNKTYNVYYSIWFYWLSA